MVNFLVYLVIPHNVLVKTLHNYTYGSIAMGCSKQVFCITNTFACGTCPDCYDKAHWSA